MKKMMLAAVMAVAVATMFTGCTKTEPAAKPAEKPAAAAAAKAPAAKAAAPAKAAAQDLQKKLDQTTKTQAPAAKK